MRWEGRPAKYQVDAVATLRKELDDAGKQFASVVGDIHALDAELKQRGLTPIAVTMATPDPLDDPDAVECLESSGARCHRDSAVATEKD